MESHELRITLRITEEQGHELLRRLAEDDDFRREMEAKPAEVLASYGIEIDPPEAIPPAAQLASKDDIAILVESMGGAEDPFGRVSHGAWRYHMLPQIFVFGALPLVGRE